MSTATARENRRPTILVVDDEAGPRDALKVILRPFFNIRSAENAANALAILNTQPIDLIVLDQRLPDRHGMDLLQDIKQAYANIEVIIITGHGSVESAMEGIRHGAAGYLLKPFNVTELITLVNQTLEKKRRLDFVRNFFRSSPSLWNSEQESSTSWQTFQAGYHALNRPASGGATASPVERDLLPMLSDMLESTNRQLLNHSSRVSFYATLMGTRLNLTHDAQQTLVMGAFLHDIGKTHPACYASPAEQTSFTESEMSRTKHPDIGARFVRALGLPVEVSHIVLHHHEQWDGQGFPHGLKKEDIPLLARIVSITQTFDHLTAEIPGRPPVPIDQALLAITLDAHTRFDPVLADMFSEVLTNYKASLPPMVFSSAAASSGTPAFPVAPRITH